MPSVMAAAMNKAEASNSRSPENAPFATLKRALDRIHMSKGMQRIRISVMELGRFTLREIPEAGRAPVWIMLQAARGRQCRFPQFYFFSGSRYSWAMSRATPTAATMLVNTLRRFNNAGFFTFR
jgi:hypothetical protein